MNEDIPLPVDLPAAALKSARRRVSRLQTVNDRFESARIQGPANGEGPQTTRLSHFRRVPAMAGSAQTADVGRRRLIGRRLLELLGFGANLAEPPGCSEIRLSLSLL